MRMILATTIAATALASGLASCASSGAHDTYDSELRRLTAECAARGGTLSPTGQLTGRPQTDNICRITGGASRLTTGG